MTPSEVTHQIQTIQARSMDRYDEGYREFLKHLLTLSVGALTLLVALRSSYAPPSPQGGWLLSVCWCSLCAAALMGLWALFGEAQWHREFLLEGKKAIAAIHEEALKTRNAQLFLDAVQKIPYIRPARFRFAAIGAASSIALAMVSLAGFAVLNSP